MRARLPPSGRHSLGPPWGTVKSTWPLPVREVGCPGPGGDYLATTSDTRSGSRLMSFHRKYCARGWPAEFIRNPKLLETNEDTSEAGPGAGGSSPEPKGVREARVAR